MSTLVSWSRRGNVVSMQHKPTSPSTQRRLWLIRHAKAVEEDTGDHGRGLSPRGRADAAALGTWLVAQDYRPAQVLCSTATRTRETLGLIADAFAEVGNLPTILRDKLYLAPPGELLREIQTADDAVETLMLIAHNPGLHGLLALLAGEYEHASDEQRVTMKFPTSACAVLTTDAARWREITPHSMKLEVLRWQAES